MLAADAASAANSAANTGVNDAATTGVCAAATTGVCLEPRCEHDETAKDPAPHARTASCARTPVCARGAAQQVPRKAAVNESP
eukprot:2378106-Alexandrium_andersonii.AAC.1